MICILAANLCSESHIPRWAYTDFIFRFILGQDTVHEWVTLIPVQYDIFDHLKGAQA